MSRLNLKSGLLFATHLVLVGVLATLVGLVFYGNRNVFTNPSTAYAIGDLTVDWGIGIGDVGPIFVVPGMAPGNIESRDVNVSNGFPSPRSVGARGIKTSEIGSVSAVLDIEIKEGTTTLYGPKTLDQFFTESASKDGIPLSTINPGRATTYTFKITFQQSSGDEFQGASVTFDITVGVMTDGLFTDTSTATENTISSSVPFPTPESYSYPTPYSTPTYYTPTPGSYSYPTPYSTPTYYTPPPGSNYTTPTYYTPGSYYTTPDTGYPYNSPPTLSFPEDGPYADDGIDPNSGDTTTEFTFRVIYTDADNDPPSSIKLSIQKVNDGVFEDYFSTKMTPLNPDDNVYTDGNEYTFSRTFPQGTYRYAFKATDGNLSFHTPFFEFIANQSPVAAFTFTPQNPKAGKQITFDASASSDSDGQIVLYEWDWNSDGTYDESTTASTITHSFHTSGTYNVILKVTNSNSLAAIHEAEIHVGPYITSIEPSASGAPGVQRIIRGANFDGGFIRRVHFGSLIAEIVDFQSDEIVIIVPPGSDTVEIFVETIEGKSNKVLFSYNTPVIDDLQPIAGPIRTPVTIIGHDLGKIGALGAGFHVKFGKSIAFNTDWADTQIVVNAPSDYGTGENQNKFLKCLLQFVVPSSLWLNVPQECLDWLLTLASDGVMFEPASGRVSVDVIAVTPAGESNKKQFTYEVPSLIEANLNSPGELLVHDSLGRITGVTQGETHEEIPLSFYDSETETVVIPSAGDIYTYEIVGTSMGSYGLEVAFSESGRTIAFAAENISTTQGTVHQYSIDWDSLAEDGDGIVLRIDRNGDGIFEKVVTADSILTADEFILQTDTIVDFVPDTLNLQSMGKVVTAYIELPLGFNVSDIAPSSIRLNGTIPALAKPTSIGDYDSDGTPDLMVKFDGAVVRSMFAEEHNGGIAVSGKVLHFGEYLDFLDTDSPKFVK